MKTTWRCTQQKHKLWQILCWLRECFLHTSRAAMTLYTTHMTQTHNTVTHKYTYRQDQNLCWHTACIHAQPPTKARLKIPPIKKKKKIWGSYHSFCVSGMVPNKCGKADNLWQGVIQPSYDSWHSNAVQWTPGKEAAVSKICFLQ